MAQILESTRNYLKSSTRLGRRMSLHKDVCGNETSHYANYNHDAVHPVDDGDKMLETGSYRPTSQRRLSSFFGFDERNKNSVSDDRSASANLMSRKVFPESGTGLPDSDRIARRNSKSSAKTHESIKSRTGRRSIWNREGSRGNQTSIHMEHEVPRGRSPTLSLSNTVSTAASSYDARPSDYASVKQYQAHVWRRNILEESIMHSLKLGYAERQRSSSSRRRSLSTKNDSPRARRTRERAILAAAMGRDLTTCPESEVADHERDAKEHVNIIDRSLNSISSLQVQQQQKQKQQQQHQSTFQREKNSPYQLDYNASMANITHSFATFTLELPEHQVSHVMNASMVPDLFQVKGADSAVPEQWTRAKRDSTTTLGGGGGAHSLRLLGGTKPIATKQQLSSTPSESYLSIPSSTTSWSDSVNMALGQMEESLSDKSSEEQLKTLRVLEPRAV